MPCITKEHGMLPTRSHAHPDCFMVYILPFMTCGRHAISKTRRGFLQQHVALHSTSLLRGRAFNWWRYVLMQWLGLCLRDNRAWGGWLLHGSARAAAVTPHRHLLQVGTSICTHLSVIATLWCKWTAQDAIKQLVRSYHVCLWTQQSCDTLYNYTNVLCDACLPGSTSTALKVSGGSPAQ